MLNLMLSARLFSLLLIASIALAQDEVEPPFESQHDPSPDVPTSDSDSFSDFTREDAAPLVKSLSATSDLMPDPLTDPITFEPSTSVTAASPTIGTTFPAESVPIAPSMPSIGGGAFPVGSPEWSEHNVHDSSHESHNHHPHHHDHHEHHHSSEHHDGPHWWNSMGDHDHDYDHHHHHHHQHSSEEEHRHHNHGHGSGDEKRGSWHRYLQSDRNGGSSDWMRYMNGNGHRRGCGVIMQMLGVCSSIGNSASRSFNEHSGLSSNDFGSNPAGNSASSSSSSGGQWWQQRLGDAGSQKIPNPLPPDTLHGSSGTRTLGSAGTGSFGSGTSFGVNPTINIPKGAGTFDDQVSGGGGTGGLRSSASFGFMKEPAQSSFGSGTGGLKDPSSFGTGTGGLKDQSSFTTGSEDLKDSSTFFTGTGGLKDPSSFGSGTGLKNPSSFGSGTGGLKESSSGSGGLKEPSAFGDWNEPTVSVFSQGTAETTVPCKTSQFVGFTNGRMRFKCDCGSSGISFQEDQCVTRAPALRAPIIHARRPDSTFDWIGR